MKTPNTVYYDYQFSCFAKKAIENSDYYNDKQFNPFINEFPTFNLALEEILQRLKYRNSIDKIRRMSIIKYSKEKGYRQVLEIFDLINIDKYLTLL